MNASSVSSKENKPTLLKHLGTPLPVNLPLPGCPPEAISLYEPYEPNPSQHHSDLGHLPPDVDPEVFRHLPESIQKELLSSFQAEHGCSQGASSQSVTVGSFQPTQTAQLESALLQPPSTPTASTGSGKGDEHVKETSGGDVFFSACRETLSTCTEQPESNSRSAGSDSGRPSSIEPTVFSQLPSGHPSNVDPAVFSALPPELQTELLSEWRQQKPALKIPTKRAAKAAPTKDKKLATKAAQANSLLNYFKPS